MFSGFVYADVPFESTVQEPYNALWESLKVDKDEKIMITLKKWDEYVESLTSYSTNDYAEAIRMLQKDYSELIAQMEQCLEDGKSLQKNSNTEWFNQFVSSFGVSYLKDKEKSVHYNLGMIIGGAFETCCGSKMERLFFKETSLYGAYREFFSKFLDFYKKQPAEVQELLKSRKNEVDNFMKLIDRISIVKVMTAGGLHRRQLSEVKAKSSDKAIYEYFKANPPRCDIDPFKAMEEFRKAMKSR
jgi:hypothetical protein